MSRNSDMKGFVTELSKANVLRTLIDICERPGFTKNVYADTSKTSFYAIDVLKRWELIHEEREEDEKYYRLYPSEFGKSLYTGLWYAFGKGELVPHMQAADLLVPFVFWPTDEYTISRSPDGYVLNTIGTDDRMTMRSPVISPSGDLYFSSEGSDARYSLDVYEDVDTTDKETQECIREIVASCRENAAKKMQRDFDDLINFDDDEDA